MKGLESQRNYQVKTMLLSRIYTMTPPPLKCKNVLIPSEVLREKKAEVTMVCRFFFLPPPHTHTHTLPFIHSTNIYWPPAMCHSGIVVLFIFSPRKPMNLH